MPMAMGVPITAAALLETTLVSTASSAISAEIMIVGLAPAVAAKKTEVIKSVAPVATSALPSARLATTTKNTEELIARIAAPRLRQRVSSSSATPAVALTAIGIAPVAAKATTNNSIASAMGAFWVLGRLTLASSTRNSVLCFKFAI